MQYSEGEAVFSDSEEERRGDWAYGCAFCLSGKESLAEESLLRGSKNIRTCIARHKKWVSDGGRKSIVEVPMFPGYVFFEAPASARVIRPATSAGMLTVLRTERMNWRLYGEDEKLVRWLFERNGLVDFSKAYSEGERIRIISGPLKDLEGRIMRIDRRNRSGQVELSLNGRSFRVWLGFEIVEEVGAEAGSECSRARRGEP